MIDVVFVVPSTEALLNEEFGGTLLLATILKQNGISVDIHRFYEVDKQNGFFPFVNETAEILLQKQPKIVSFYCRCDCFLADVMIAKRLKEQNSDLFIVLGGPQVDASANDILAEIPWIDFCCSGEGETTVYPLFSALLNGTDYSKVAGLTYRRNGEIKRNPSAELLPDLDLLPNIDYSLIPTSVVENTKRRKKSASIEAGRGCPFNCAYCSSSLFWSRKFRLKSAQRIVDEMIDLNSKLGISRFQFQHDLFTANKRKLMEFVDELKKENVDFKWACSARTDTIDEQTIAAMNEVGLRSIFLGIESGSERIQKCINKHLKLSEIKSLVRCLKNHKIVVTASFIYGFPEETEEDLEDTLQLAFALHEMGVDNTQFHSCVIFPGTEYYKRYADQLVLSEKQSNIVGDFGVADNQEFIKAHQKLFAFSYEYPTQLRKKYQGLEDYYNQVFALYSEFVRLLPDKFKDKKLTELMFEILELYRQYPDTTNVYMIGQEYVKRYIAGSLQDKLIYAFRYYSDSFQRSKDPEFVEDTQIYPINITDLLNKKTLEEIGDEESVVIFHKSDKTIQTFVC